MRKILWAPWRMEFIKEFHKKKKGCLFCTLPRQGKSRKNLVLYKGKRAFIILNRYPYSYGHLMVVPHRHFAEFSDIKPDEHVEMGELISRSIKALKKVHKAQGFNVGLNLGSVAGAGIKKHLHYHVIPRWLGDHNVMPAIGNLKVMPEYLEKTYESLKKCFE